MKSYRKLTAEEILRLESQACYAEDWSNVLVSDGFRTDTVFSSRFSGTVKLGRFDKDFSLPGGMIKHSGLYHTTLHNVEVGDDCCIENVKNYIANYVIGDSCLIINIDVMFVEGTSSFGNGIQVAVLNETGGREVIIFDGLTAQMAYVMALYRYLTEFCDSIKKIVCTYCDSVTSDYGYVGSNSQMADVGYVKNVRFGEYSKIVGCSRLVNGTVNSNETAPVKVGVGVIAEDFIVSSGSSVCDGVMLTKCFVGQACTLGHGYSASDSLFFANCHGENGEACSIFAGPFTVTHHKSSLLIAGMFSFMNTGSGSNQSNHMYKLGPIHQGIMERGAKTASDSYILWPARVGAFSLVMGRHSSHQDTSDLPFSYLIEKQGATYIMPGANLKSVGTIRDAKKWPLRDVRKDPDRLDLINFNLLSPYTMQKMLNGIALLERLKKISGHGTDTYVYQNSFIKKTSLDKGLHYYSLALDKFLGNSLISRIQKSSFSDIGSLREALRPDSVTGLGQWVDVAGLIVPKSEVTSLLDDIQRGEVHDISSIRARFEQMQSNYYEYEWVWAYEVIKSHYGVDLAAASIETLVGLVHRWKESVLEIDSMLLSDAKKEFSLSAMTSFGADGTSSDRTADFEVVRGAVFENDSFVCAIKEHIIAKTRLCDDVLEVLDNIY